jgi:hypothetical protein
MAQILAPFVASMNFTGSGTVEHINKPTYQINDIEYLYGASLAASHGLFAAFTVTDGPELSGNADVTVVLADSFKAALRTQMEAATGGKLTTKANLVTDSLEAVPTGSGVKTMDATMKDEVTAEIEAALNENNVVEFLEADSVALTLTVEWSNGAASMYDGLTAELLKGMYLQIGNRAIANDQDAGGPKTFSQILQSGDKLAFVFDVNGQIAVTESPISANPAAGANATMTAGAVPAPPLGVAGNWEGLSSPPGIAGLNVLTGSRRVGFIFTVQ